MLVFFLRKTSTIHIELCSGMPLRKVHELTFLWFGLPGPLLIFLVRKGPLGRLPSSKLFLHGRGFRTNVAFAAWRSSKLLHAHRDACNPPNLAILIAWYRPSGPKWEKNGRNMEFRPHQKMEAKWPENEKIWPFLTHVLDQFPIFRPFFPRFPSGAKLHFAAICSPFRICYRDPLARTSFSLV